MLPGPRRRGVCVTGSHDNLTSAPEVSRGQADGATDNCWLLLTLQTSSSWEVMSRQRCSVLPSTSSSRINLPPSSEALWPSRGWPGSEEGGPWALAGREHSEGQRGGERVRGGITVL